MIQTNEEFKNKILKKTKEELDSLDRYPSHQENIFYTTHEREMDRGKGKENEKEHIYERD